MHVCMSMCVWSWVCLCRSVDKSMLLPISIGIHPGLYARVAVEWSRVAHGRHAQGQTAPLLVAARYVCDAVNRICAVYYARLLIFLWRR